MSSEFIYPPVNAFIKWHNLEESYRFSTNASKNHVYCLVFSRGQRVLLEALEKEPSINILYKAPPAINTHHGGQENQQTLVIFEFKE